MKNLIIRNVFLSISGTVTGILTAWLAQKSLPPELAGAVNALLVILGMWGISVWQGKPMKEIQKMIFPHAGTDLEADGLAGEGTIKAIIEAVNNPQIKIEPEVRKAKVIRPMGGKI